MAQRLFPGEVWRFREGLNLHTSPGKSRSSLNLHTSPGKIRPSLNLHTSPEGQLFPEVWRFREGQKLSFLVAATMKLLFFEIYK
jgi:hypothetical protein